MAKKLNKGFKRSEKEWEESIASHIGKFIDKLSVEDILTIGIGVLGAIHLKHPGGFLWGAVGLKLAMSDSLISSGSGLATLAALGLAGIPSEVWESMYEESLPKKPDWYPDFPEMFNLPRFR